MTTNKIIGQIDLIIVFVEITTDQNIKIIAQYAIVIISSSAVLLMGNDCHGHMFSPKLPDINQDALDSLKRGVYTKVFFQFPYKFWDDVELILTANEEHGASSLFPMAKPRYVYTII